VLDPVGADILALDEANQRDQPPPSWMDSTSGLLHRDGHGVLRLRGDARGCAQASRADAPAAGREPAQPSAGSPTRTIGQQLALRGVAAHQKRAVHASGSTREGRGIIRVAHHALNAVGPRPRFARDREHADVTRAQQIDERAAHVSRGSHHEHVHRLTMPGAVMPAPWRNEGCTIRTASDLLIANCRTRHVTSRCSLSVGLCDDAAADSGGPGQTSTACAQRSRVRRRVRHMAAFGPRAAALVETALRAKRQRAPAGGRSPLGWNRRSARVPRGGAGSCTHVWLPARLSRGVSRAARLALVANANRGAGRCSPRSCPNRTRTPDPRPRRRRVRRWPRG
jgi:hypothetical protein